MIYINTKNLHLIPRTINYIKKILNFALQVINGFKYGKTPYVRQYLTAHYYNPLMLT